MNLSDQRHGKLPVGHPEDGEESGPFHKTGNDADCCGYEEDEYCRIDLHFSFHDSGIGH